MSYVCTGKLTLFPVLFVLLGIGSGFSLASSGEQEVLYGLLGALVGLMSIALFAFLIIWLVLRITFSFSPTHIRILKSGFVRSSYLEFNAKTSSLHYFRTHFSNEKCWLSLVVRENDNFYQIFSWRGQGAQEKRFLELFKALKTELKCIQRKYGSQVTSKKLRSEILSKEEITFIRPFDSQLKSLIEGGSEDTKNLCIEDITVTSYDNFFNHFNHTKTRKIE
eukprot:TRINITY_DN2119_c0_g1_i1.p1 TRINITY_DN2119_c0_g1~~TRINITY_DN2119_c0_g1_i1.p1  ORF type:complete len:222 (+),score=23.23 TRINITY_DN2119_c0_g1_i1:256-921(+)